MFAGQKTWSLKTGSTVLTVASCHASSDDTEMFLFLTKSFHGTSYTRGGGGDI